MNPLPKLRDFQTPEGYFDRLPDRIIARSMASKSSSWTKYAAAAVVVLGLGLAWQFDLIPPSDHPISMEEEANLYIESQVWTAEDILSMANDPNAVLDRIIEEEMSPLGDMWVDDELNWF